MTTPASLYRNAIDLNRYSNSVARRIVVAYNDIILDAVSQLQTIDELAAPVKAARLRAILAQTKESLATWAGDATGIMTEELQGLAVLQSEFVEDQLAKALPRGQRNIVNTVEVQPGFAQSVVMTDPTQINVVTLSDDLFAAVQGAPQTFSLTAAQGATITLPNGKIVEKAFRGIAEDQAERFAQTVRQGLLTGEPTADIAKRLRGSLEREPLRFGQRAKSVKQIKLAGGELTKVANHQIDTLVRTSVNQVSNAASNQVYIANQDISKEYRYIAVLDSRTSAICRALDGQTFPWGKGPLPPQHFNCRSTHVGVVDWEGLGLEPPDPGKRAAADGQVPADTTYGKWLYDKNPDGTLSDIGYARQKEALGSKAPYFRKLARKYDPDQAIRKLVRDDGSELTLADLRRRYGRVNNVA